MIASLVPAGSGAILADSRLAVRQSLLLELQPTSTSPTKVMMNSGFKYFIVRSFRNISIKPMRQHLIASEIAVPVAQIHTIDPGLFVAVTLENLRNMSQWKPLQKTKE